METLTTQTSKCNNKCIIAVILPISISLSLSLCLLLGSISLLFSALFLVSVFDDEDNSDSIAIDGGDWLGCGGILILLLSLLLLLVGTIVFVMVLDILLLFIFLLCLCEFKVIPL